MARGIYPQILYEPTNTVGHDVFLPEGTSIQATPLGPAAAAPRQKWGLTFSLLPTAWLLTVTEGTSRAPGTPPRDSSDIDIRRGDSFIVIWLDGDWSLLERSPGDLDRFGRFELPAEMEVAAEQQFNPQGALYPDAGHPKARPPARPADSGNESERSWPSSEGSASSTASSGAPLEDEPEHDRTELMQKPPPGNHHSKKPEPQDATPPADRGAAATQHRATTT